MAKSTPRAARVSDRVGAPTALLLLVGIVRPSMGAAPVTLAQGLRHEAPGLLSQRRPVVAILLAYAAVAAAAACAAIALGYSPLACQGWLGMSGAASVLVSLGFGVSVAALTVATTRWLVPRVAWVRALHEALRPSVTGATDGFLLALASASAVGEELLFRGLLVPLVGVFLSSLLFGALHQVRGEARWGWAAWATAMGLLFAAIFASTGSLVGPIAGHMAINAVNLRFLRDAEPKAHCRTLGGLLHR